MRTTRLFTPNILLAGILIFSATAGCAARQTILGQESGKKYAGFASTTKTQYVATNRYVVDIDKEQDQQTDPSSVLDVRIIGNEQIGAKDIIKIIKTKKGRPFNESVLEEDKRALMQKGWFIDVKPKVEKTLTGYIITFQFIERPILHYVKVLGNRAHTKKILLEEANIKPGDALDPIAVHQAKERMEQFYRDSGFYRVHVEILCGDQIGDRGAVFLVSEGIKQRILDVEFEGNSIASSSRLKTQIQSKPGWFFWINSEFTRKKLDEDTEVLTAYYRKLGYFYAKIDREFEETEGYTGMGQNRAWIKVKFVIDEGPRCRIRNIRFVGQKVYTDQWLLKTMKLPKEKYFNQDMLEVDMQRIKDEYGKVGHVFARAEPDPRIDEDFVDLVINVKEGPRCYLNSLHVEIVGNEGADPYTKWHPILNRMSLHPGDILSTKEINASKRRLMASQLFNTNPTQGQMPDIIFSYPEEAIEDEEREAALAGGNSTIRGQAARTRRLTDFMPFRTKPDPEEELGRFSEFFRIQTPRSAPSPVLRKESGESPVNAPAYQPEKQPVEPMKLSWKDAGAASPCRCSAGVVYRGQSQFVTPNIPSRLHRPTTGLGFSATPSTPAPSASVVQAGYTNVYPGTYGSGSIAPAVTSVATSPSHAGTYQQVQYQAQQQSVPYSPGQYQTPLSSTTRYQPANISPPKSDTIYPGASNVSRIDPATYTPPTNIAMPGVISPASYLSPPTDRQYVGSGSLYNQGMVFAQHTAQPETATILGNPYDNAINNSAYGLDPNNPMSKLYGVDGKVVLQETRTGQLMMSVAVSSDAGLMGRFIIEEQNFDILNLPKGLRLRDWKNAFRGKGQRFRIEAVPGTEVQRYSMSWETPYLFDLDYSFGLSGFYYERYHDEWYEERVGGTISFGKLWTPDFSTRLSLGGQQVKIYRPISPTPTDLAKVLGHHPMYSVGIEAIHNTRDSEYMPTEGHMISFGVEQVLGDYQFVRGSIDARKYFTLHERPDRSGRWVLGLRSSLGVSEKGTPIYERYYGGGFTNLRGFEYRGVSPRDENGIITGGCMEFYNSAELVFPITADDMIRGSLFVDTGTIERSITKWESDYRVSLGFGLRLTIPMMGPAPIALDFAFPVSKQSGDEKQIFSFNVGFMR